MNERELGRKIVQNLDGGLDLTAEVCARLEASRARALAAQRRAEPSPAAAALDEVAARLAGPSQWFTEVLLPVALLIVGLVGLHYWEGSAQNALFATDPAELDAQLLKSDLPIDAYLDRGFEAWLKRSSE
jgi:Protein of unknown function (DUF3619)